MKIRVVYKICEKKAMNIRKSTKNVKIISLYAIVFLALDSNLLSLFLLNPAESSLSRFQFVVRLSSSIIITVDKRKKESEHELAAEGIAKMSGLSKAHLSGWKRHGLRYIALIDWDEVWDEVKFQFNESQFKEKSRFNEAILAYKIYFQDQKVSIERKVSTLIINFCLQNWFLGSKRLDSKKSL